MYEDDEILTYDVLSDDEIKAERGILAEGIYEFQVAKATKKTSQSGNPMIELSLKVWGDDGKEYTLFDWLVLTRKMAWKIKDFWESVGEPENYNGQLSANSLVGKLGSVKTKIEKDKKGFDQARVEAYATDKDTALHEAQTKGHLQKPVDDELDDDIPF